VDLDRVAVAQVELELLAHQLGAIADAGDLEALAVTLGHADDHVVEQRPGEAVELARTLFVVRSLHAERTILLDDLQLGCEVSLERATRTLDRDVVAADVHLDTCGNGNGKLADSGHDR